MIKHRKVTITAPTERGVNNYPVCVGFDATGAGAIVPENYEVLFQGRSVPFQIIWPTTTNTLIWFRVNLPMPLQATADIYYGSSVCNAQANKLLSVAGMNFAESTNTLWVWADGAEH